MDKRDNSDVLASSLAAVIRQSVNAPFRRECFLLLGVSNIRDATEKISQLLKHREMERGNSKKRPVSVGKQGLATLEDAQQSSGQNSQEPPQNSLTGVCESTDIFSEIDSGTAVKLDLSPKIDANGVNQITDANDINSDEESQLDWDVEPISVD